MEKKKEKKNLLHRGICIGATLNRSTPEIPWIRSRVTDPPEEFCMNEDTSLRLRSPVLVPEQQYGTSDIYQLVSRVLAVYFNYPD